MAIHEPLTEPRATPVASCPLCSERFILPAQYKSHLAEIHALVDDAGTDTVAGVAPPPPQEPKPEPEAPPTKAEVRAKTKEAKARPTVRGPRGPRAPRAPRLSRPNRPSLFLQLRLPAIDAGGRYPLALRFGDVALYVPGALLVAAGVVGRGSDTVSLTMAVFGAVLVMTGMLLPLLHRTFLVSGAPTDVTPIDAATSEETKPAPTLEEALLSLPPKR